MALSKMDKILAEKVTCVMLVRGKNPRGKRVYAFVAIQARDMDEFMAASNKSGFAPTRFGPIIASGEGEPDKDTVKKMHEEYGFDPDNTLGDRTED